jgi:6-phosphogluconate dehydrogenase
MQIAIIGLGRMGANMAKRLLQGGHEVIVYNRTYERARELEADGAIAIKSLEEIRDKLRPPRTAWIMLPAGAPVDEHIAILSEVLDTGDIIVDGGNSHYKDDIRRADTLRDKEIEYLDVGVSGGIWGLEIGYCTMVGGDRETFKHIEPIIKTLAPKNGYLYCGPCGAGHYVKMVHNGIEYAMMEAYGEGFELLKASPFGKDLNLGDIAYLWNQGSVVRSWLLELLERALSKDPSLSNVRSYVEDSGEGRWTVEEAIERKVPATSLAHSLFKRYRSRQDDSFSDKILAALRNEFGGH